jgi:hypothetical protein
MHCDSVIAIISSNTKTDQSAVRILCLVFNQLQAEENYLKLARTLL